MKKEYYNILFIIIVLSSVILVSCTSEFSQYEKSRDTDLELNDLRGDVKEVTTYWNGELSSKEKYNKWGFYTLRQKYDEGELSETIEFQYNEKGWLDSETSTDKEGNQFVRCYTYDEKGNPIKTIYYTIKDGIKSSEQFGHSYENVYDENGNLVKVIEKDGDSSAIGNYSIKYYNLRGKIVREDRVDEQGNIKAYMSFEYYATGDLYRTNFLYPNGQIHDYWEEIYNFTYDGKKPKPIKRLHIWPNDPDNYWEQTIQYNNYGDCIVFDSGHDPVYDEKFSYQYDDKGNWIYKKTEGIREEKLFSDNKGGSQSFAEEKREIKFY